MTDFWSKAVQKKISKMANKSLRTISYETSENMTINDKTNPQPSTEILPSNTNTAVKQNVNTVNDILMGLYRKRDLGQLSQSDHAEITSREATLRKYKADLKQKEVAHKRQQKFRVNKKLKIQAIEEQTKVKLLKNSEEEEKHVDKEELIAVISRITISGSAAHERRRSFDVEICLGYYQRFGRIDRTFWAR